MENEHKDDFEDKMEEDEVEALDEEDRILGLGDGDDPDEDDDEESLDKHGFHSDEEEEPSDF